MGQVVAFSNSATRVGVLIVDSVALNRQLMTLGLQRDKRLEVLDPGKASIFETAKQSRPQVILLSERANETSGGVLEILKELRHFVPESRIVMLVDEQERQLVVNSFRMGARGVFCRCQDTKMLACCIHRVQQGQFWVSACQMPFLVDALSNAPVNSVVDARGNELLSPREQQVVRWMVDGLSNREIAKEMRLSENTIKNYVYRIFNKLGVSNRVEVVMYAASQRTSPPARRGAPLLQPPFSVVAAGHD